MSCGRKKCADIRAVIFDLDGTLLDTLDDIAAAANRVLTARGLPGHNPQVYRGFVGDGSEMLMTRALPPARRSKKMIRECFEAFLEDYSRNWHQATRPYAGIDDLLTRLQDRSIRLAVVTNKPHQFTRQMMEHYFAGRRFQPILGQRDGIPKKPHPQQALAAAAAMKVSPRACIFLGDSNVDMQTARRAGMLPVGAGWGFRPVAELMDAGALAVIESPGALLHMIDG